MSRQPRRALVTGGTKGLGLAIAEELARHGLEVVVTYARDDDAARTAVATAHARGLALSAARCDAASPAAVGDLFERERELGFDVLVHAAGFTRDGLMIWMPRRDFDEVLAVHLTEAFLSSRRALPAMEVRGWGRIVTSPRRRRSSGRRGQTNYGAAKAGLLGLCRSLAREVGHLGITVTASPRVWSTPG